LGRGRRGYRNQFYATGLTGWQRAQRGMQAWGSTPAATPTGPIAPDTATALNDLQARAQRLETELGEVRETLARLRAE
jgi:hypothetical protein